MDEEKMSLKVINGQLGLMGLYFFFIIYTIMNIIYFII